MPNQKKKDAKTFRAKLEKLNMMQMDFGKLIDRSPRTVTRWASGRDNIPTYVWRELDSQLEKKAK